jgi:hypothetical protein
MDTGILSVKKIFEQERRHVVPLFQRPYVWEKDKQWEPLWDDIRTLAERILAAKATRPHFLGAIVLDQMAKPTGHVETRQVIDGQQRLTTMQIFLEAFCDLCGDKGWKKHYLSLLKLTRNDDPLSKEADEQFKVWPTNVDQAPFRLVMQCESPAQLRTQYGVKPNAETGHPIADAYLYFHGVIGEWLDSADKGQEQRLEALFEVMRNEVRLVVIDLNKDDDAQMIFETLNARGTPLLPSDLVKNFLFHQAGLQGEALEPLYDKYWEFFDEGAKYWRRAIGRGHARRYRIDIYLQHYLTVQTRDEVPVGHLYMVFRDFASQNGGPRETLTSIKKYADIYRSFDDLEAESRAAVFFRRVGVMDITTAYPFLMELFAQHGTDEKALKQILQDVESFLVRRMVCQLNTRGYNRLFLDLLKTTSADGEKTARDVRAFLLSSEADSNRWPPDVEFKQAWLDSPLYRNLLKRRLRMLLETVEFKLRTGKSEKIEFKEKLTIEHLMPQHWHKHWPLDSDSKITHEDRDARIHTLGNLTLLTGKLNPALSNGSWAKKRPQIMKHSLLKLNHELRDYPEWDEACIRKRGKQLFDVAKTVWARPNQ